MSIRLRRMGIDRLAYAATLCVALACVGVPIGCSSTPTQATSLGEIVVDTVITDRVKAIRHHIRAKAAG